MPLQFIETDKPLQPHHGGIAAWHRSTEFHELAKWLPDQERQERAALYLKSFVAGMVDAAYDTAGITISRLNRTTVAYNHANYDYLQAPNYTDRLRALIVPRGTTSKQLFFLQHRLAHGAEDSMASLTAYVHNLLPDTYHVEYAELALQQALGALPTLHTTGAQTPLAIQGVWVPNIGINQDGIST